MIPMISEMLSLYFKGKCCVGITALTVYVTLRDVGTYSCQFVRNGCTSNLTNKFSFRSAILGEVQTRGSTKLPSYKSVVVLGEFYHYYYYYYYYCCCCCCCCYSTCTLRVGGAEHCEGTVNLICNHN